MRSLPSGNMDASHAVVMRGVIDPLEILCTPCCRYMEACFPLWKYASPVVVMEALLPLPKEDASLVVVVGALLSLPKEDASPVGDVETLLPPKEDASSVGVM